MITHVQEDAVELERIMVSREVSPDKVSTVESRFDTEGSAFSMVALFSPYTSLFILDTNCALH